MKVLGIYVLVLLSSLSFILLLDILLGFSLPHAFYHLVNPFWVIESGEYLMLVCLFLLIIGQQIFIVIKNRTE
ncbi:hypothetical protein SAMN05444673_3778 [Bacillus sp. OV166]|uniref:hypothetical protein n=1 Tax=Bacillus sp. OV166 TaxID=1882763 RepID=UPI000A2ABAE7|nr:hypothetical protein [Bacillus sp. OV166]SMQ79740.1 hypothetical protein SAMN05444673_3778 [Bacillus sp. OV166]